MASAGGAPLVTSPSQQLGIKSLCEASANAFLDVWPAVASARPSLTPECCFDAIVARMLLTMARPMAASLGLDAKQLDASQLAHMSEPLSHLGPLESLAYDRSFAAQLLAVRTEASDAPAFSVDDIAAVYESLLALSLPGETEPMLKGKRRKRSGSYYTPRPLAKKVVEAALAGLDLTESKHILSLKILDPAMGAGVFLIEACRSLAVRLRPHEPGLTEPALLAKVALGCLHGVDVNPLSVAVCQLCLWLEVGNRDVAIECFAQRLRHGNALLGSAFDSAGGAQVEAALARLESAGVNTWRLDFREAFGEHRGFDLVIGNPPWVAYAGRSAQRLPPALRKYYSSAYRAWRGFPTLHGLFVERACQLAPRGTISLLLPSPVADLDGYSAVRQAVTQRHEVERSLPEFGQDAFIGVTQPCFALVARPSSRSQSSGNPWQLRERQRANASARSLDVPEVLLLIARGQPFDAAHFKELGFQTTRVASQTLLLRAEQPDSLHTLALLEGRNINEFWMGPPKLFLRAELPLLKDAGCRLRAAVEYTRVDFVVRQTASVPIAALHGGLAFRNSLLAGFASEKLSKELMVALLNSSLYRALHIASQRDARQATFPQVKIKHLRALPRPPSGPKLWHALEALAVRQSKDGVSDAGRSELDRLVFELFGVPDDHQAAVLEFLMARAPRFCPKAVPLAARPTTCLDSVARALEL